MIGIHPIILTWYIPWTGLILNMTREWEGTWWTVSSTSSDIKMHYKEYKERLTGLSTEEEEDNRCYCVSESTDYVLLGKAHRTNAWYRPQRRYVWRTCHPHGDSSTQKHGAKNRTEKNVGVRIQHDKRKLTMTSYSTTMPIPRPHPPLIFRPLDVWLCHHTMQSTLT